MLIPPVKSIPIYFVAVTVTFVLLWEVLRTTIEEDDAPLDVAARLQQKQRKATSQALETSDVYGTRGW